MFNSGVKGKILKQYAIAFFKRYADTYIINSNIGENESS